MYTGTAAGIGRKVRERRRFLSVSQKDLAEIAGISLRSLKEIENGKGNPTLQLLVAVGEALGLELTFADALPDTTGAPAGGSIPPADGSKLTQ